MSSMSSPSEQDSLMRYYSGYLDTGTRVRSRASQHRDTRTPEPETASTKVIRVREGEGSVDVMTVCKNSVC